MTRRCLKPGKQGIISGLVSLKKERGHIEDMIEEDRTGGIIVSMVLAEALFRALWQGERGQVHEKLAGRP